MRLMALVKAQALELRRNLTMTMVPVTVLILALVWKAMADESSIRAFSVAVILMSAYMVGMHVPAVSLAEDKEKRTLEAVLLTPVRPHTVIGARTIVSALLTLLTAGIGLLIFGVVPVRPGVALAAMLLAMLLASAIGVTIGLLAPDQKSAGVMGTPVLLILLLGSVMPWAEVLPSVWEVSAWLPTRPLVELLQVGMTGAEFPVGRNVLVMLPYIGLMLWLAARQIRRLASAR